MSRFVDEHMSVPCSLWLSQFLSTVPFWGQSRHLWSVCLHPCLSCVFPLWLSVFRRGFYVGLTVPESTSCQSDDFSLKHVTGARHGHTGTKGCYRTRFTGGTNGNQTDSHPLVEFDQLNLLHIYSRNLLSVASEWKLCKNWKPMFFLCACLVVIMTRQSLRLTVLWNYTVTKKEKALSVDYSGGRHMCLWQQGDYTTSLTHVLYYIAEKGVQCIFSLCTSPILIYEVQ